jgi:hypothetical protein
LLLRSLPSSYNLSSRGPVSLFAKTKANFPARKDALLARIASVEAELGVVVAQAKAERATSVEVKTQVDELVRQRALALISLRKTNRAIDELRKTGAQIPVDLASVSGGFAPWGSLLLGHAGNVGIGGKAARGYLVAVFNAGLLSRAARGGQLNGERQDFHPPTQRRRRREEGVLVS